MAGGVRSIGERGEAVAASYMESLGYSILARNYHSRFGEIDIIARDGGDLVFVEVKCRKNADFGTASEAVDFRKRRKLVRTAFHYLSSEAVDECDCRFDVVEVYAVFGRLPRVELIKGAFSADD